MEKIVHYTSSTRVACRAEENSMHPLVYLDLQRDGRVTCPYCGAIFVHRGTADDTET